MSGKNILFLVLLLHQYYPYFCDKVKIKKMSIIVMFLVLEVKYPGRRNLRKAELVLAQSLRLQSITVGRECRTAGHNCCQIQEN